MGATYSNKYCITENLSSINLSSFKDSTSTSNPLLYTNKQYTHTKSKANSYYKHGRFKDSIKLNDSLIDNQHRYSLKNDEISKLCSNNGMNYYFLNNYESCLECCEKAIEHDSTNIKGLRDLYIERFTYFLGNIYSQENWYK